MNVWLIVATSGRMLAQAAQREGFDVLVIDCFADIDTSRYAKKIVRVDSLSIANLTTALSEFTNYEIAGVVYGSGFETCVESLYFLEKRFNVAGNSAAVFESVQNKQTFFAALDSLKIPYPETHFSFPNESKNWLSKPLRGQGGVGINSQKKDIYWQYFYDGQAQAGSVLFLANGEIATIIGFNRQWTRDDFLFLGISNHSNLNDLQKTQIYSWLQSIVV
ncbi:MAG: ATP-dependent carboxylate-amine ligase, partial [Methylococcales bacterium]